MTVGEALAEARYRAGLTVDEVSERTRIRETVIRCIEQDDYEACGGELYVRGYVRAIAGAVGIDAQPLIREYDAGRADGTDTADRTDTADGARGAKDLAATMTDLAPVSVDPFAVAPEQVPTAPAPVYTRPREPSVWSRRIRGRKWVTGIVALVAIALVVAGIAGTHIVSSLRHAPSVNAANAASTANAPKAGNTAAALPEPKATGASTPLPSPSPAPAKTHVAAKAPRPVTALRVKLAAAFGSDGLADGDNPQGALFAITGKSPLPWQTHWYATASFGLLKHGTGLLLDMGKTVTITSVRIDLSPYRGASLQLRAGGVANFSDLRVKARATDVGGTVRLRLASPVRARYLLIWFTLLPPNGSGEYQESVYRVVVNGRP